MRNLIVSVLFLFCWSSSMAQNDITNKLGSGGTFKVLKSDASTQIFSARESDGFASMLKVAFTPEGGLAVKMKNKTGSTSVKGTIVTPFGSGTDNACALVPTGTGIDRPIGVMYETGVADGSDCWVVVAGIADVLLASTLTTNPLPGYVVMPTTNSGENGKADCTNDPNGSGHDKECGHFLESKTGGNQLVKAVLHFR